MQRLSTDIALGRGLFLVRPLFGNASCSPFLLKQSIATCCLQGELQKMQKHFIPGDLLKWGSLGFVRTSRYATGFKPLQPKPLDSIIDMESVKSRSPQDLATVWDDVNSLNTLSSHCGEEVAIQQCLLKMPHMLFTGLEDYKARGTQAAPYFTVSYYTEFAKSKDLVLIRGDVVFTSKLSDSEAKWLLETTQTFYLNDVRYKLVARFNKETRDFQFKDVLQALDMPIL